jgi:hypothetical protein
MYKPDGDYCVFFVVALTIQLNYLWKGVLESAFQVVISEIPLNKAESMREGTRNHRKGIKPVLLYILYTLLLLLLLLT